MAGAIIQEWIAHSGGSERVFDEFAQLYPDADLYTLWSDVADPYPGRLTESWLAGSPMRRSKVGSLPFMVPTWRLLRSDKRLDWVLVSSHLFAHHARFLGPSANATKLVYAHTPARYIWAPELDERGASIAVRAASTLLKPLDRARAKEAATIAANSEFTRERIQRSWGRDAVVIYPPVDVAAIQAIRCWSDLVEGPEADLLAQLPDEFVLGASRLVPYKRVEAAIAAGEASGLPVVIAGTGPEELRLRALAGDASVPVHFVGRPSNEFLRALYERAAVYVFLAIEDFGIMPVEAMALGAPVVTAGIGGTAESVIDGLTGAAVAGPDRADLTRAIDRAMQCDPSEVRDHALRFDRAVFQDTVAAWVASHADEHTSRREASW